MKTKFNLAFLVLGALLNSSVIHQSKAASWVTNGPMNIARAYHTATLLQNGKVLVAGGDDGSSGPISSAELYDPATGTWTPISPMTTARLFHTTTLLSNGKVLVAGGIGTNITLASAELYDPILDTWTATGSLRTNRVVHTATLLLNGKVLVAGGAPGIAGSRSSTEIYDPATGTWTETNDLITSRARHTATLLSDGKVFVTGGYSDPSVTGATYLSDAETYNPSTGTWTTNNPLPGVHFGHTAMLLPDGKVLVTGGQDNDFNPTASCKLYDPTTGMWAATNSLNTARFFHTATLLPNGKVLIVGGNNGSALSNAELFDPITGTWITTNSLATARYSHTATLLPNGKVLVVGGVGNSGYLSSTEVYDSTINPTTGTWTNTGAMNTARRSHTAELLADGKVLVVGGAGVNTELRHSITGIWTNTGSLHSPRDEGSVTTLLPDGRVLVVGGGFDNNLPSVELYDSVTEQWTATGALQIARSDPTVTSLLNGKALVAGGYGNSGPLADAELYDPSTGLCTRTGNMTVGRYGHSATSLADGTILVAGGDGGYSAEIYDSATGTWTATGAMTTSREYHTATLLPDGKVLVAGGWNPLGGGTLSSAELFDPITKVWTSTGTMTSIRKEHTATLLFNGTVLVAGGHIQIAPSGIYLSSTESYDPTTETWTSSANLITGRGRHTACLLLNGKVLITGGYNPFSGGSLSSTELFEVGLGFSNSWRPQITSITSPLNLGGSLVITGSQFRGISGASSGNSQDSSTDYPLVQLRSLDSERTMFLLATNWSTNSFASVPVWNFPPGYALATVFVSGIPSTSSVVNVSVPIPTPPTLTDAKKLTNGSFQFGFTNSVGALFGVLTTTNVALPASNWVAMGGVAEISPGQFQFTDSQTTNDGQRFYRVSSP